MDEIHDNSHPSVAKQRRVNSTNTRALETGDAASSDDDRRQTQAANELSPSRSRRTRTPFAQACLRFVHDRVAMTALVTTILVLLFSFGAPLISHFVTHRGYADQVL